MLAWHIQSQAENTKPFVTKHIVTLGLARMVNRLLVPLSELIGEYCAITSELEQP